MRIGAAERFAAIFDGATFEELIPPEVAADPLRFRDEKRYSDRMKDARSKTGRIDALAAARGTLDGLPVMVAVQAFDFMGGSLGMARGRGAGQRHAGRGGGKPALHPVRRLGRRAHAGRHALADADAARHHRGAICCAKRGCPISSC